MVTRTNKLLASAVAMLCAIQARAEGASGFDLSLGYVGEWVHNASGGERTTTAYADQFTFGADLDFETLWGWRGASMHLVITNRNGPQLDAKAGFGTLLETHEIFGRGHFTRLTRFYLQQKLLDDRVTFKIGRSDVDFFPFSCDFINISFCGALPGYHSKGWYTWPIGQYFANVTVEPGQQLYVKLGATDVNPNNLDGDQGLRLHTRDNVQRGTLSNLEMGWLPRFDGALSGSYRIGYWRNSTSFPDVLSQENRDSSTGYYALVQQQLTDGLSVFANFSHADGHVNKVDRLWSVGLKRAGLGVAIGNNRVRGGSEKPVELNYTFSGPKGLALMPSLQYVKDAGGRSDADDIWIFGVKVSAQF